MSKATDQTLDECYKPFDIVKSKKGSVGYIKEVSVNECQNRPDADNHCPLIHASTKAARNAGL